MHFLFLISVLIYLTASIFQALYLVIGKNTETPALRPTLAQIAFWVTCLGFGMLTLFLILWWSLQGHFPMSHWTDSTSFFAWAITLIYLIIGRRSHLRVLGSFVIPVAFITILISYSFSTGTYALPSDLETYWLVPHVTLIFFAYAAFITAFGFGLLFLMTEKKIRDKIHSPLYNVLPSLHASDEFGHRFAILGVILLTAGVIIGAVWTQYINEEIQWRWLDAKVLFTVVTWCIYVVQLSIRQLWGWRGRKAAYSEIIGFIAVLCTYIGVNLFLDSVHTYR